MLISEFFFFFFAPCTDADMESILSTFGTTLFLTPSEECCVWLWLFFHMIPHVPSFLAESVKKKKREKVRFLLVVSKGTDEKGTKHDMFLEIEQFDSTKPDPKEFHVPYECSNNNNHVAPLLTRPFMKLVQARKPLLRKLVSARK